MTSTEWFCVMSGFVCFAISHAIIHYRINRLKKAVVVGLELSIKNATNISTLAGAVLIDLKRVEDKADKLSKIVSGRN